MIYNTTKFRCDRCGHEDEIGALIDSNRWDEIMRDNDLHLIHDELWCGPCVRGEKPALKEESTEKADNSAMDAIALLREWVYDSGGKVCNDLYERSRKFLEQQHQ